MEIYWQGLFDKADFSFRVVSGISTDYCVRPSVIKDISLFVNLFISYVCLFCYCKTKYSLENLIWLQLQSHAKLNILAFLLSSRACASLYIQGS